MNRDDWRMDELEYYTYNKSKVLDVIQETLDELDRTGDTDLFLRNVDEEITPLLKNIGKSHDR